MDISTLFNTQEQTLDSSNIIDCDSRLVRQYMCTEVSLRTNSNTRTKLNAFCKSVCDLENKPYTVKLLDLIDPLTSLLKEGHNLLFSFQSRNNFIEYLPSGFNNRTVFENKIVRNYRGEFLIRFQKNSEDSKPEMLIIYLFAF